MAPPVGPNIHRQGVVEMIQSCLALAGRSAVHTDLCIRQATALEMFS